MGGVMDANDCFVGGYGIRLQGGRAANSDTGLVRTIEILKKIVRIALFAMLPWNVYAEAERFPGAQVQLDGLVNTAAPVDNPPMDNPSAAVSFNAPAQETITRFRLPCKGGDRNQI